MSVAANQTGAKRTACDDRPVLLQQNPNVGIKIVADETTKRRATWSWEVYVKELWNIVKDVKGVWLIGICRRDATPPASDKWGHSLLFPTPSIPRS
jgi:hypothetical protein